MTRLRLLAFLLLPALASTTRAQAPGDDPVVAQIQVYGLKEVPESRVRELIGAREWAPYAPADLERDREALRASGLFSTVSLETVALSSAAVRLDIRVAEAAPPPPQASPLRREAAQALGAAEPEIPLPPWVIGELEISGNRNVRESVIRAQIKARKGDLYSRADHDRDVQAVMSLGSFDRVVTDIVVLRDREIPAHFLAVSPSSHPVRLTFIVEEKPVVDKILFEGRQKVSKGRLLDEVSFRKGDPLDRLKLREAEDKILEAYRKKGFHRAAVSSEVKEDTATHKAEVLFTVEEGPKARIAAVSFTGVEAFKPKKVARKMKNRRKKVYDEKRMPEDLKAIEALYKNEGYQDFEILSSSVTFSPDLTEIFVHVAVKEGPQYRFGKTTFSGHTVYSSTELAKAVDYRQGKLFNQERFEYTLQTLREMYAEKGRLRTIVDPVKTLDPETGRLDVRFEIEEGGIVYVDHVDVEGNKATKKHVLRRELVIKPGEPFSISKVRKSQQRLMNLGFLDDVQMDVTSPFDPDKVDLLFEVYEGKPGMLTAGAGFSSLDGLIGTLSLQHMNLFGRAWRSSVQWSFGSRVNDFSVSWTTPWLYQRPISLGFDVFNTRRLSPFEGSNTAFTNRRTGGTVRVGPRFADDKYQLHFTYTAQRIEVANVEQQFLGTLQQGTSFSSLIGVEAARDTRDNIWDPTEGTRNSLGFTFSGGALQGDIHFFKPFVSNSFHKTLFRVGDYPFVMSASNRAGYVTPFGETKEVPVFERFFIGGQDTLRGYAVTGEVGARNGGQVFDVFNLEFGFPLARERRRTIVKFVTFFDAGGSWARADDVRMRVGLGENDIKTNVGFGIRFTTPAFPIRLDWGYGLQHRPGEDRTQINFGIGSLF